MRSAYLGFPFHCASDPGFTVWPPVITGLSLLGDIAIPLLLFSLGVRLNSTPLGAWRIALVGAVVCPVSVMLIAWPVARLLGLSGDQAGMLRCSAPCRRQC